MTTIATGSSRPSGHVWASPQTWETHRAEITRLYQTRTLSKVMAYMSRVYGFHATERMYKFRIKSWGLRKNWDEEHVKQILEGRTPGLENALTTLRDALQGLPDNELKLRRLGDYLNRHPTTLAQIQLQADDRDAIKRLLGQAQSQSTGTHHNGEQKPSTRVPTGRPRGFRLRALAPCPSPAKKLRAHTKIEVPDEMFRLLSTFLASMREDSISTSGSSTSRGQGLDIIPKQRKDPMQDERMLEFVLKFRLAHNLILINHHRAAFLCLSVCFDFLSAMLPSLRPGAGQQQQQQQHQCGTTLLYVLNAALEVSTDFANCGLSHLLGILFRYLTDLATIRLGTQHPATEISRRFVGLVSDAGKESGSLLPDVLGVMRRLRVDSSSSSVGENGDGMTAGEVAFSVYDKTVEVWSTERQHTAHVKARSKGLAHGLEKLLDTWDLVHESYIMTLWLRMRMFIAMLDEEDGVRAVSALLKRDYPAELLIPLQEPARLSLVLQCYKIRGYIWLREGMVQNAGYMFDMGRSLSETTWGKGCDIAVGFAEDGARLAFR